MLKEKYPEILSTLLRSTGSSLKTAVGTTEHEMAVANQWMYPCFAEVLTTPDTFAAALKDFLSWTTQLSDEDKLACMTKNKQQDPLLLRLNRSSEVDVTAIERFDQIIRNVMDVSKTKERISRWYGLTCWAYDAYPQISMGHRYAASLMATSISASFLSELKAPFRSFSILLPDGLLSMREDVATRIHVQSYPTSEWVFHAVGTTGLCLYRNCTTSSGLCTADVTEIQTSEKGLIGKADVEERSKLAILAGRLIANVCLAMSDPRLVKETGPGHKRYKAALSKRQHPEPIVRTFQVGAPVKHDMREAIANYLGGTGTSPTVQVLVAGHWKYQPHGPGRKDRKKIHVEPYWRGPEDAPILRRDHVLVGDVDGP